MAINQPPIKSNPAILCDWVEIKAISSPSGKFRLSSLKRFADTHRETEDTDFEGQHRHEENTSEQGASGEDADAFLDSIIGELSERAISLSDCYPFELDETNNCILLKSDLTEGEFIYLFCLFLSNSKRGEIFDGSWLPHIDHVTRDLFQVCATLAAAGEVRGSAISFGWPRPNNNPPFLKRLQEVYALFGEGEVVTEPRPGVSPSPKDEEVDVIAWTPRLDNAAGTYYLLGQVASGDNWEAKSIKSGGIDYLHHNWFYQAPASTPQASIFIPHLIQVVERGDGSRADRINALTPKFGTIFDRLRLPCLARDGIRIADGEEEIGVAFSIERRNDIPQIRTWLDTEVNKLRAATAALV
jgi:hypothetical protein